MQIIDILNPKQNEELVMTNRLQNICLPMKHKKGFNNMLANKSKRGKQ